MLTTTLGILLLCVSGTLFGIGVWCLACFLVSVTGGWRKLAKRFGTSEKPDGPSFWLQYALLNGTRYRNCLSARVTPRGLYLSIFPLFGVGHPPLLIPWENFGALQPRTALWLSTHVTTIKLDDSDSVKLEFTGTALVDAMRPYLPAS